MRAIPALLLLSLATLPALGASSPFTVLRAGDPWQTPNALPLAVTGTSPFDDAVGTLGDGENYCYLVRDAAGYAVPIGVDKNEALGAVRLVFDPDVPLSQREIAAAEIEAMTGPGGSFEALLVGLDTEGDPGAEKVLDALAKAQRALAILSGSDLDQDPAAMHNWLKRAVGDLLDALDDPGLVDPASVEQLIDDLLTAARRVAVYHIGLASAGCGACGNWGPSALCDAETSLVAGDVERASADPDFVQAAKDYANAVTQAMDALDHCQ